jgi:hypothetical protein
MVAGGEMPLLGRALGGGAPPVRYLCAIPRRLLIETEEIKPQREHKRERERERERERGQEGYL